MNKKIKVTNSYYVGRCTGDQVTIRTIHGADRDRYVIFNDGWRVTEYSRTASVRRYIVANDLQPVVGLTGKRD